MVKKIKTKRDDKTAVKCIECGHKFKVRMMQNTYEITCPKCHSIDIDFA